MHGFCEEPSCDLRDHLLPRARRVLVVDDSRGHRALCARVLADAGYDVQSAPDGRRAWELLRDREFDLVVSDGQMPAMSGVELLRRVRADWALGNLPVILLTAMDGPEERSTGLAAGASDYICKHHEGALRLLVDSVDRLMRDRREAVPA